MKSLSPLVGVIPIFMLLVPSVYAGGPRYDYDESFEDIPGVGDCYNDGYEADFAQKYDGNRANECTDKEDQYNVGFGYGCRDGGLTKEDCIRTWIVLEGCTTQECIMKCRLEPLPAPPECARGVLL